MRLADLPWVRPENASYAYAKLDSIDIFGWDNDSYSLYCWDDGNGCIETHFDLDALTAQCILNHLLDNLSG